MIYILFQYLRRIPPLDFDIYLKDMQKELVKSQCASYHPTDPSCDGSVSLSFHVIQTKVRKKRKGNKIVTLDKNAKESSIVVAVKGQPPNVLLPEIEFGDPMTVWRSATRRADPSIALVIDKHWEGAQIKGEQEDMKKKHVAFTGNMAEFLVFCRESVGIKPHEITLCDDTARLDHTKCEYEGSLDVWSHNGRINSLHHQLLANRGITDLDNILNLFDQRKSKSERNQLMQDSLVKEFIARHNLHNTNGLPTSFKYPTMQMKHNILPLMNQVGVETIPPDDGEQPNPNESSIRGCLVRYNDNRAHLKLSKVGHVARGFRIEDMEELIGYHREHTQRL